MILSTKLKLMMNKLLPRGSLKHCGFQSVLRQAVRNVSSALFVTNDLGAKTTSIIAPYIDLREFLKDPEQLQRNLAARNLSCQIDALSSKWSLLLEMCHVRENLLNQASLIQEKRSKASNPNEAEPYKIHSKLVKQDLKFLAPMIIELEKMTILEGLKLPNFLHPDTPLNEEVTKYEHDCKECFENSERSHVEIGEKLSLLEFTDVVTYFLLNEAARFEIAVTDYFTSNLLENWGFFNFSNADFCKSVVIEGVGHSAKELNSVFRLADFSEDPNEDDQTFLVGGASLEPFCAYHCKSSVHASALPLKYVSQGRSYTCNSLYQFEGLYNVVQTNAVEVFIATVNDEIAMMNEFNHVLGAVVELYKRFNLNFRYTFVPASALNLWESLRVSFQIFSPYHGQFIEVGNLSISDDFISKRLRMHYHEVKRDPKFLKIISGSIVKVAPLLACILERNQSRFTIPECLSNHLM